MANRNIFAKKQETNEAGGMAFDMPPQEALAQYALTGCMNNVFYADAQTQLNKILELCHRVTPEFVAKTAVHARTQGGMKDVPALLTCFLVANRHHELFQKIFPIVINNGKMLRNFIQIITSGVTGKKCLGRCAKRMVQNWFYSRTPQEIFMQCAGTPSMKAIIKLSHPRPLDKGKNAMNLWFLDKLYIEEDLPQNIRDYNNFVKGKTKELPTAPGELLMAQKMDVNQWCMMAMSASWHWLRANLNTLKRNKVFEVSGMPETVAERLADETIIKKSRVYPYQIMNTLLNADVPEVVQDALSLALDISLQNVPVLPGNGFVLIDISGSMQSPVTGHRQGATTKVNCCHVAALLASSILQKNPGTQIIGFNGAAKMIDLEFTSVMQNSNYLVSMVGGGTNCAAPLDMLNKLKATGSWIVMISDNQSWMAFDKNEKTESNKQWNTFKENNADARMVCIDLQPYTTSQVQTNKSVLNVGGWGDSVYDVMGSFIAGEFTSGSFWVDKINKTEL